MIFVPIIAIPTVLSLADATDRMAALVSAGFGVLVAAFFVLWFSALTVEVTASEIVLRFGFGFPRATVPRADIMSATRVRLRWHLGSWGNRYMVSTMKAGTATYMVWPGGNGVALALRDGKTIQIGTNHVDRLLKAPSFR